jgi:hypothetical protein
MAAAIAAERSLFERVPMSGALFKRQFVSNDTRQQYRRVAMRRAMRMLVIG